VGGRCCDGVAGQGRWAGQGRQQHVWAVLHAWVLLLPVAADGDELVAVLEVVRQLPGQGAIQLLRGGWHGASPILNW